MTRPRPTPPKFEWRILALCVAVSTCALSGLGMIAPRLWVQSKTPPVAEVTPPKVFLPPDPVHLDAPTTLQNSYLVDLGGLLLRIPGPVIAADAKQPDIYHVDGKFNQFGFGFWYPEMTATWLWDESPPPSKESIKVLVLTADLTDPTIPLPTDEQIAKGNGRSRRPTPSEMARNPDGLDAWGEKMERLPSKKYPNLLDASAHFEKSFKEHPERIKHYPEPRTPEENIIFHEVAAEMDKFRQQNPDLVKTWPKRNSPPPHDPNDIAYSAPLEAPYELAIECQTYCRGDVFIKDLNIQYFMQISNDSGHLSEAIEAANNLLERFSKNADNKHDRALLESNQSRRN